MLINIETGEYPVTENEFLQQFPNTSFPRPIPYHEKGYAEVTQVNHPTITRTQTVDEISPALVDGAWTQQWEVVDITDPDELAVIKAQVLADKLAALAAYRYEKETAGITVGGAVIKTDEVSQSRITGAWATAQINPDVLIDWKGENGWAQINKTAIDAISMAVSAHVQACYSKEKFHAEAINALATAADIEAYDITTGWPE